METEKLTELHQQHQSQLNKDREYHDELNFQINGESRNKKIEIIKGMEDKGVMNIRDKYGIPINWLWSWMLQPINKIFSANGGSIDVSPELNDEEELLDRISRLKTGSSVRKFMQKQWLKSYVADPSGVVMIEYDEQNAWPVIYSVDSIQAYGRVGRYVNWIIFKEKRVKVDGKEVDAIRVVDIEGDVMYFKKGKDLVEIDTYIEPDTGEEKKGRYTLPNGWTKFGYAPALILGDTPDPNKKKQMLSVIHDQVDLGRQYYQMDSIKTFVAIRNGYGVWYWYTRNCDECDGEGKHGDDNCKTCGGSGKIFPRNLSDVYAIDINEVGENAPQVPGGLIEGDVSSWQEYREDLKGKEKQIELGMYGTHRTEAGDNNTATGTFVDNQTAVDVFHNFSSSAEFTESWILTYIASFYNPKVENVSVAYGRRLQIENPETLWKRYWDAKAKGLAEIILNRFLREAYESEYKYDMALRDRMLRLMRVEPGVHLSVQEFSALSYPDELKLMKQFISNWEQTLSTSDILKTPDEQLLKQLKEYSQNQIKEYGQINEASTGREETPRSVQERQNGSQRTGPSEETE